MSYLLAEVSEVLGNTLSGYLPSYRVATVM